jgi:hypothetical protein
VVYYLIATDYLKQRRENETLAFRIEGMTQALAQLPTPPADPEERLRVAQSDFEATRNSFPDRLNTTSVVNTILRLAEDTGVKAIPLVTQPWQTESFSGHDYSVFRLDISVTGTFTKTVDFINGLENGELSTLLVESVSVERADEETAEEGALPVETSVTVAVFARPPVEAEVSEAVPEGVE